MSFPQRRTLMKSPTWWAGRTRTAFLKNLVARSSPTSCQDDHGKQQTPDDLDGCPTRVAGRTRTMFHNTLVLIQVSESQENQAKQQNARRSAGVSDQGSWSD